jgi:hypothetical protein
MATAEIRPKGVLDVGQFLYTEQLGRWTICFFLLCLVFRVITPIFYGEGFRDKQEDTRDERMRESGYGRDIERTGCVLSLRAFFFHRLAITRS